MILYIDSTIRKDSRTRFLADYLVGKLDGKILNIKLDKLELKPLTEEVITKRNLASKTGDYSDDTFTLAKQFRDADTIVIAAPYWDLSFPSLLKTYVENICVSGITFRYNEMGVPVGLCKAKKVYYITTSGGKIYNSDFGFGYIKGVFNILFGVKDFKYISAEELDVIGNNVQKILDNAIIKIDKIVL